MQTVTETRALADGRKIERRKARCRVTGQDFWQFQEISSRPPLPPDASVFYERGEFAAGKAAAERRNAAMREEARRPLEELARYDRSPGEIFAPFERATRPGGTIDLCPHDPLDAELVRLSRDYPALAAWIEARREQVKLETDPQALFPTGDVVRVSGMCTTILRLDRSELLVFLARHRQGDFGIGQFRVLDEASDERWAPPFHSMEVQNSAATMDQSGLIQSKYSCVREDGIPKRREGDFVRVTTLLCPGRPPQTCITSSRDFA